MVSSILKQAAGLLHRRKLNKRWQRVLFCMAVIVAGGTVAVLMMTGRAMTHKEDILECGLELHKHTEECYDADGELICGYMDFIVHVHSEEYCYSSAGEKICSLPVTEEHVHTDACYEVTRVRICGMEECAETSEASEPAGHEHTDACYEKTLSCEKEDHTHADVCYEAALTCGAEEHAHEDTCYETALVCESEDPEHEHTDACYEKTLICGKEEHKHGESCYEQKLICETEEHIHEDACYTRGTEPVCGLEEAEPEAVAETKPAHVHSQECYEEERTLICEKVEWHFHTDACYDDEGVLTCGIQGPHIHTEECLDEDGIRICGQMQLEEHIHTEACIRHADQAEEEPATEAHVHEETCYDEDGLLICGYGKTETEESEPAESETVGEDPAKSETEDSGTADSETAEDGTEPDLPGEAGDAAAVRHIAESYEYTDELFSLIFHVEGDVILPERAREALSVPVVPEHGGETADAAGDGVPEGEAAGGENLPEEAQTPEAGEESAGAENLPEGGQIPGTGEEAADDDDLSEGAQASEAGEETAGGDDLPEGAQAPEAGGEEAGDGKLTEGEETSASGRETMDEGSLPSEKEEEPGETGLVLPNWEEGEFTFQVEKLAEDSELYAAILAKVQKEEGDGLRMLQAMNLAWSLSWEGEELDLSGCDVRVEIVPAEALFEEYTQSSALETAGSRVLLRALELSGETQARTLGYIELNRAEADGGSTGIYTDILGRTLALCIGEWAEEEEPKAEIVVPIKEVFDYEDDAFSYTFHIAGEVVLPVDEEEAARGETADETVPDTADEEAGETVPDAIDGEAGETPPGATDEEAGETVPDTIDGEAGEAASDMIDGEVGETPPGATDEEAGETVPDTIDGEVEESAPDAIDGETGGVNSDIPEFVFKVEELPEDSQEYAAFEEYANQSVVVRHSDTDDEERMLRAIHYSLSYAGEELDLSECLITVEVTPVTKTEESAVPANTDNTANAVGAEGAINASGTENAANAVNGAETADAFQGAEENIVMRALKMDEDGRIDEVETPKQAETQKIGVPEAGQAGTMLFTMFGNNPNIWVEGVKEGVANPKFTVQYYANLDRMAESGSNALPLIDTSGDGNGEGGRLPVNGRGELVAPNDNPIRSIYLHDDGTVSMENVLTEVYAPREMQYISAPSINYMNALVNNANYSLKEVWVQEPGGNAESTDPDDWEVFSYDENLHFSNREAGDGYVYIKDGAVLRLVYDTTTGDADFMAAFYDYDISTGVIYKNANDAKAQSNGQNTGSQDAGTWHVYTKQAGINSAGNYSGEGTRLAFGNSNTGTSMGTNMWTDKNGTKTFPNKLNATRNGWEAVSGSYKGCTFGLVTSLEDGKLRYADGIVAPNLFNEGPATGKTAYDNEEYSLKFNRNGDTYTLTAVNGTSATGLESFHHPAPQHTKIWTNNFWPMDSAGSFGTDGHDMKSGSSANAENRKFVGVDGKSGMDAPLMENPANFPPSDDGQDHNSYFGMKYEVKFDLSEDYAGPLEYYFFGDDDMWVFLDGKLVCDIGGVHSSVGEYVNLWDYLKKGSSGEHTLSFFYTERGASGSTCWMQFTLPSVSSIKPEEEDPSYGDLKIEKTVTKVGLIAGEEPTETPFDTDQEFWFHVSLEKDGVPLPNDYSYTKYRKAEDGGEDEELESNLVLHDGSHFTLKHGEYVMIRYLPEGTKYTITEVGPAVTEERKNESGGANTVIKRDENSLFEYNPVVTVTPKDDRTEIVFGENENLAQVTGYIRRNETGEINQASFNNKFDSYGLPQAGGLGTNVYTMAGALSIALGAGFVYKKKSKERRGDASG